MLSLLLVTVILLCWGWSGAATDPTGEPTGAPSGQPSGQPSGVPTGAPSRHPTPQPTEYEAPKLYFTPPKTDFVYWCRPIHYLGGPQGSWQRIDSGLTVNATINVDYIKIWIETSEFEAEFDELGMIRNEYERNIFGFKTEGGNEIQIRGLGDAVSTDNSDWTKTIRFAGYRIPQLANEEKANLCSEFVGTHTRTIKFQVYDVNGGSSEIYSKSLTVHSATFMFTDREAVATDQAASTSLGMPGTIDVELASNFNMTTQGTE